MQFFLEELPERMDRLDQLLIGMEQHGVDSKSFNEFYRTIHSLKGSGGTFGMPHHHYDLPPA